MKNTLFIFMLLMPVAHAIELPAEAASDVATIKRYYATVQQQLPGGKKTEPAASTSSPPTLSPSERDPFAVSPRLIGKTASRSKLGDSFAPAGAVFEGADRLRVKAILFRPSGGSLVSLLIDQKETVTLRAGETLTLGNHALRVKMIERDSVAIEAGTLPNGTVVLR